MSIRVGRTARLRSWALAGLCLMCACAGDPAKLTQIVVVVDSDLTVPDQLDNVQIEVTGIKDMRVLEAPVDTDGHKLPRTLGLMYSGGPLGPLRVIARGQHGGETVVERVAEVHFKRDRTLKLALPLTRMCKGKPPCEAADETCDLGECVPVAMNLPVFDGDDRSFLVDAGPDLSPEGGAGGDGGPGSAADGGDAGWSGDGSVQPRDPSCTITAPLADGPYYEHDPVAFDGSCTGAEGEALEAQWTSTLVKKLLGTGNRLVRDNLPIGTHEISLCAVGTDICAAPLQIDVETLPELTAVISSLAQQGAKDFVFSASEELVAIGKGTGVPPVKLTWIDSIAGEVATGETHTFSAPLVPGRHMLRLVVEDGRQRKITAERGYVVHAAGRDSLFEPYTVLNSLFASPISALATDGGFHYVGTEKGIVWQIAAEANPPTTDASFAAAQQMAMTVPVIRGMFVHPSSGKLYLATGLDVQACDVMPGKVSACMKLMLGSFPAGETRCVRRVSSEGSDYLAVGTSSGLWVGGMSALDKGNLRVNNAVFNGLTESANRLWIAGSTGLSGYALGNGMAGSPQAFAGASGALNSIVASADVIWAALSSGITRYDAGDSKWTNWTTSYAAAEFGRLVSNDVRSIAITHPLIDGVAHDVIWVGTGGGLSRFDPEINSFTSYSKVDGLPDNTVLRVLGLPSNEVLIATPSGLAIHRGQ